MPEPLTMAMAMTWFGTTLLTLIVEESVKGAMTRLLARGVEAALLDAGKTWADTLPPEIGLGAPDAALPAMRIAHQPGTALHEFVDALQGGTIPSERLIFRALVETHESVQAREERSRLAPFFQARTSDVEPHLRRLAELVFASLCQIAELFHTNLTRATIRIEERLEHVSDQLAALTAPASIRRWDHFVEGVAAPSGQDRVSVVEAALARIRDATSLLDAGSAQDALGLLHRITDSLAPEVRDNPVVSFKLLNNQGVALMRLGRHADAVAIFRRACTIEPQSVARTNLAAALISQGQYQAAAKEALGCLELPSLREKAGAIAVAALAKLERDEEVAVLWSRHPWFDYSAIVVVELAQFLFTRGRAEEAWPILATALEDNSTAVEANVIAATNLLMPAATGTDGLVPLPIALPADTLTRARGHLERALAGVGAEDSVRGGILVNLGFVLSSMNEVAQAEALWREAREIGDSRSASSLNLAMLFSKQGRQEEAAAMLATAGNFSGRAAIVAASVYLTIGRPADTINTILAGGSLSTWGAAAHEAAELLYLALGDEAHIDGEKEFLGFVTPREATDLACSLLLVRHYSRTNQDELANDALQRARGTWPNDPRVIVTHGRWLASRRRYTEAIEVFSLLPVEALDGDDAIALAVAYYNEERYGEALGIAHRAIAAGTNNKQAFEIVANVQAIGGSIDEAVATRRSIGTRWPDHLPNRLELARLLVRAGQKDAALEALESIEESAIAAAPPETLLLFAGLLHRLGSRRAVEYAYRAWELGQHSAEIQRGYVTLLFMMEPDLRGDDPDQIGPGTYFVARSGDQKLRATIMEPSGVMVDPATYLPADSSLAKLFLGRQVGEEVTVGETPLSRQVWTVEAIGPKYVRALQDTAASINTRFPEAKGIWKTRIDSTNPFSMMRMILDATEHRRRALEAYRKKQLPIALVAKGTGFSVAEAMGSLIEDPDTEIIAWDGTPQALEASAASARKAQSGTGAVLDVTALVTLLVLPTEVVDAIISSGLRLVVLQSLVDTLREGAVQDERLGSREGMVVSVRGGRLVGGERPKYSIHQNLLELIERLRASIMPASFVFSSGKPIPEGYDSLGLPQVQALAEAPHAGFALWIDDGIGASLGKEAFSTEHFGTQALLRVLNESQALDNDAYRRSLERLSLARYRYISVNREQLFRVLEAHNWQWDAEVDAVFSAIDAPECNFEFAMAVAADVVAQACLAPVSLLATSPVVAGVLAHATKGRNRNVVLDVLKTVLTKRLWLAPFASKRMELELQAWRETQTS